MKLAEQLEQDEKYEEAYAEYRKETTQLAGRPSVLVRSGGIRGHGIVDAAANDGFRQR